MNIQTIIIPSGERLVVLAETDYVALVAAAEDATDRTAIAEFGQRLAVGEEEFVPAETVDRILAGENRVRVWRQHRGLSMSDLAKAAGIGQGYLSQIEAGRRIGTTNTLGKIAAALSVGIDEVAPA